MADKMTNREMTIREGIKDRKRIVVKIGSSSLHHMKTGELNLTKMERLVRELCELKNQGRDVILVSSGAIIKAGMCRHRTGKTDDDLRETVCGI